MNRKSTEKRKQSDVNPSGYVANKPKQQGKRNPTAEELAMAAFMRHEQGFRETKIRKVSPQEPSSSSTTSHTKTTLSTTLDQNNLDKLSKNVLSSHDKTPATDCGEDFDKLGDLESVVCFLNNRIPTGLFSIPPSKLPNGCNFSILDHLKFLIPSTKKGIQERKQIANRKTLKQPSKKTKMAITSIIQADQKAPSKVGVDKKKVQKLKHALTEILKNRETRLGIFGAMPYELLLHVFSFLDWRMLHKTIKLVTRDWYESIINYEHYIISSWHHFDFFTNYSPSKVIDVEDRDDEDTPDEQHDKFIVEFCNIERKSILTSIIEYTILEYCKLNSHIVQNLLEDPSTPITFAILTQKNLLDYVIPKLFPNVKYLTGKGLNEYLIGLFRYNLCYVDFPSNLEEIKSLNGPFPKLSNLQWQIMWCKTFSESSVQNLRPLFENIRYLTLHTSNSRFTPNLFSVTFEKSCFLHTVNMSGIQNCQFVDFCRAIEPFMKNVNPTNEIEGLRKLNLYGCKLNKDSVQLLGATCGHILKVLHIDSVESLEDALQGFKLLEELSITNSRLKPIFVDYLLNCSFGDSLKILNIRGTSLLYSTIQQTPSCRNYTLTNALVNSITSQQSYSKSKVKQESAIEFKQELVRIFNWMLPVDGSKANEVELKLVLTDIGEFYYQRNNKRNHQNRFVWRNRLPPHETITVIRNRNGSCYWEREIKIQ